LRTTLVLASAAVALWSVGAPQGDDAAARTTTKRQVRVVTIRYRAHNGSARLAYVVLPSWYGPRRNPPLPLVISPHGRGVTARANARLWGALPARGGFVVVNPAGEGRALSRYSWGSVGQIDDLARMPVIVHRALPWLHVDRRRIYAFGGSMGGQETLLLLARHPRLLAGAAAFDSVVDLALQYRSFRRLPCNAACREEWNGPMGRSLQSLAQQEIGGSPAARPLAYKTRSPATYARSIAASCVPLQLWWSVKDRIVLDQRRQSEALYTRILKLNPGAPVTAYVGAWNHSAEMRASARLPVALAAFQLLPDVPRRAASGMHVFEPSEASDCLPASRRH
jgi:dipeptidyl aminopeptidase/acylaminoacyl peptidase